MIFAPLPCDRVQFADSIGGAVGSVDKSGSFPPRKSVLDLAKTGDDLTGLGGHRQCLGQAPNQQSLGVGGKGRLDPDVALESPLEMVTPDRFRNGFPRRGNPQAAPWQLALQVRNHFARGGDDEPNQFVDWTHLAADRAHPRGRGLAGPRSIVEIWVSQS